MFFIRACVRVWKSIVRGVTYKQHTIYSLSRDVEQFLYPYEMVKCVSSENALTNRICHIHTGLKRIFVFLFIRVNTAAAESNLIIATVLNSVYLTPPPPHL